MLPYDHRSVVKKDTCFAPNILGRACFPHSSAWAASELSGLPICCSAPNTEGDLRLSRAFLSMSIARFECFLTVLQRRFPSPQELKKRRSKMFFETLPGFSDFRPEIFRCYLMTYGHFPSEHLASTGKQSDPTLRLVMIPRRSKNEGWLERVGHGPTSLRARRHRALPKIRRLPYKLNRLFLSRGHRLQEFSCNAISDDAKSATLMTTMMMSSMFGAEPHIGKRSIARAVRTRRHKERKHARASFSQPANDTRGGEKWSFVVYLRT